MRTEHGTLLPPPLAEEGSNRRAHPASGGGRWAAALLLLAFLAAAPARAEAVFTSRYPYWKVGPRDDALSKACALGRFNLVNPERLVAKFRGKEGPETLGVAKGSGLNLRDPDRRAKPREDYYFRGHGTTSCEVFVGGRPGGAQGGGAKK